MPNAASTAINSLNRQLRGLLPHGLKYKTREHVREIVDRVKPILGEPTEKQLPNGSFHYTFPHRPEGFYPLLHATKVLNREAYQVNICWHHLG